MKMYVKIQSKDKSRLTRTKGVCGQTHTPEFSETWFGRRGGVLGAPCDTQTEWAPHAAVNTGVGLNKLRSCKIIFGGLLKAR